MKVCYNLWKGIGSSVLFLVLAAGCINHITEEEEPLMNDGNIPLRFIAGIHDVVNTRVANNTFDVGDKVGLFALAGSITMKEERYVDNLIFERSSANEFVTEESVYYPDDEVTLNLFSYYPYQQDGIAMGESSMQVAVEADQSTLDNYSHSDFLLASKKGVLASKEAIPLIFNHKFFRLKVALVPGEGENVDDMLAENPILSVSGFYTKAIYDFQKDAFLGYLNEEDVTPLGEWKIEGNRIIGKELILIPQESTPGYQYLSVNVKGKPYMTLLPSTLQLQSGKQRELEITFVTDEDVLIGKVDGEIEDWEGNEKDQVKSEVLHNNVDVSKLTFENSNVCKVLSAGKQVAEICKEYLVTPEFSSQAIVVYPMNADKKVDLSHGVVVQLLNQSGNVHGGTVSWNIEDHSMNYVPGSLSARNNVYVLADGRISLSISFKDDLLRVMALEDVVHDTRGGVIHNYPIVKIGTQYWMRSNVEATLHTDGNEIPKLNVVSEKTVGYLKSKKGNYFYTASTALSDNLLPAHWNIPNWEDWKLLKTYLKEDASTLKSGTWISIDGKKVAPVNNSSGFNSIPIGMYVAEKQEIFDGKFSSYWTLDDTNTEIAKTVFYLKSDTTLIGEANAGIATKAFAIRCIRK
ncbi:fimbrillin family protein [uncultured Bacteroides sp.]|uniref:fimbrillin family protein n=1 Tax=uncultured Bacteroides sp. TaxID=162156 RepID=UPI0025FEC203|nr:fimbrillin family protein [uncultured Bacteroides sp.]